MNLSDSPKNLFDHMDIQWFSDAEIPQDGPPGEPAGDTESPSEQPAAAFFEWQPPEGEKLAYSSPEELTEAMKKSFWMQKDYTKKTTDLKQHSERVKQREQELEAVAKQLNELGQEYKKWKSFMDARPDTYARFKSQVEAPPSPDEAFARSKGYTDQMMEELKKSIQELKDAQEAELFERQKSGLFEELGKQYPDFNREQVEAILSGIGDSNPKALLEMAYYALKGKTTPVEMERKAAEALERKRRETAGIVTGPSKPASERTFKSVAEAKQAALREL